MSGKENNSLFEVEDLRKVLKVFLKNWFFFFIIPLLAFFIAYIYTYRLKDIYAAKAQMLLKNDETIDATGSLYTAYYAAYTDMTNQTRVLTSYDLISSVIDKLENFQVSYYLVGRLKTTETFSKVPFKVVVEKLHNSLYEAPFLFKAIDSDSYELSYEKNGLKWLILINLMKKQ